MGDINTVAVDSLKALDPKRPIREADISHPYRREEILIGNVEKLQRFILGLRRIEIED